MYEDAYDYQVSEDETLHYIMQKLKEDNYSISESQLNDIIHLEQLMLIVLGIILVSIR